MLFVGITSLFLVYSCSNKEDEELMKTIDNETTITTTSQNSVSSTSTCDSTCFFGSCSTTCTGGKVPFCDCNWGFASCGCKDGDAKKDKVIASFSAGDLTLMKSYSDFLFNNNLASIGRLVRDIIVSIEDNNVDLYHSKVDEYVSTIENSLNATEKELIVGWFTSNS